MKAKAIISLITASSLTLGLFSNALACTSLIITDLSGNAYKGRSLELSMPVPTLLTYFPAGTKIESATPSGKQGLTFNTKYAILGMAGPAVPTAKQAFFAEGANDQGLTFSSQWLNQSTSPTVGSDNSKILSINDLATWILGNFKSVAEVKAAMLSDKVDFWLPISPILDKNAPFPQHYAIYDKKGGALVIEFTNGKKQVYDNPVNVLTNGPNFPWHLENLNNYTFTNVDKNTGQLGKLNLVTQDAGIALTGLPSAQTSQGRFVKAAFYANYVQKAKTPDQAILTLGHIMNNFDRPINLSVDGPGGAGASTRKNDFSSEVTQWTVMNDLNRNLYYFRSIDALNWSAVDMNKLTSVKSIKSVSTKDVIKAGADATNLFLK
jgi:penicillin V acylase-like amidase (Ntn superfamily)